MTVEHDACYNLAERIDELFSEIDNDICTSLCDSDAEYAELWDESLKLQEGFPVIATLTEGNGEGVLSLSADEHKALARYRDLKHELENIERKQIYFQGHMDCYAYLKKIGAI